MAIYVAHVVGSTHQPDSFLTVLPTPTSLWIYMTLDLFQCLLVTGQVLGYNGDHNAQGTEGLQFASSACLCKAGYCMRNLSSAKFILKNLVVF